MVLKNFPSPASPEESRIFRRPALGPLALAESSGVTLLPRLFDLLLSSSSSFLNKESCTEKFDPPITVILCSRDCISSGE